MRNSTRKQSQDASLELSAIGSLLELNGNDCPPNLSRLLQFAPESFDDQRCGLTAKAIRDLRSNGVPVCIQSVRRHVAFSDAEQFLTLAARGAPPVALAELDAETVWQKFQSRQTSQLLSDAAEAVVSHPAQAPDVRARVISELKHLDAPTITQTLPAILDASTFIAGPLTEPNTLIKGALHKGCKLVLGGSSKSFKTWTLLDLALSISHGLPWLSFQTAKERVLFVNFELQDWTIQRRVEAVAQAKGIVLAPAKLSILNLRGRAANYTLLLPQIAEAMKQDFGLVILDPIYKLYGLTDENKAGDVARLLNAIEDLAERTGAGVAFGSHFSKGNQSQKDSIDRISGSGVFARDPDSILTFTRHETDDCFTVEMNLRAFKPVEPFVVRWQYPLMRLESELDPAKLKKAGGRKKEFAPDDLLAVLGCQSLTSAEWLKIAADDLGMSERTFYSLKSELQKLDRVIQSAINRKWQKVLQR